MGFLLEIFYLSFSSLCLWYINKPRYQLCYPSLPLTPIYYATTVHCIVEWSGPFLWKPLKEDVNWYFYYLKSQYLLKGRNISKIHSTFYSPRGRGMENSTLFKPSLIGNPYFILIMKKQQVRVIPAWQRIASSNIFSKITLHCIEESVSI